MQNSTLRNEQLHDLIVRLQNRQRLVANRISALEDPSSYYSRMGFSPDEEGEDYIRCGRLIAKGLKRLGLDPVEVLSSELGSLFTQIPATPDGDVLLADPVHASLPDLSIPSLEQLPEPTGPVISDETIDFLFAQDEV